MWKYRCKGWLISLLAAFASGCALMGVFVATGLDSYADVLTEPLQEALRATSSWELILMGGFSFAGIINVLLIMQLIATQFQISSFLLFFVIWIFYRYVYLLGIILVIPMVILTLYGWLSLRNQTGSALKARHITGDAEIVRMYELHHPLNEKMKPLAESVRKNIRKATLTYGLGVVAIVVLSFVITNFMVLLIVLMLYLMCLNILLRYRSQCLLSITNLLYVDCNPQDCASAIIYFSTNRGKVKLTMQNLLAQCLIYMDDPALAQDVLITFPRRDPSSALSYWSLMAYIDYLLKDESGLERCRQEAERINLRFGPTGVMIKTDEMAAIDNRLRLMNGDFNACKKYYLNLYTHARFPYQKAEAAYYIGLISFVDEDYPVAEKYFSFVASKGGTMYFVPKAKNYLEKMNAMGTAGQLPY